MNHKYYVVIDLEFVKVNGLMRKRFGCGREIVQIGAVLLDESFQNVKSFMSYVTPQYGRLDNEIKKLTGIHKADFAGAPAICAALDQLAEWLPEEGEISFVAWSENDEMQLMHEINFYEYSNSKLDAVKSSWIDAQILFGEFMEEPERKYGLQNALCLTDITEYDDKEHDGLSDAYNTAVLFSKLMTGELEISPFYQRESDKKEEENNFGCTLGDLFAEWNIQCA